MVRGGSRGRQIARDVLVTALLTVVAGLVLFPIFWIATTAFKPAAQYFTHPPTWWPSDPTTAHFSAVPGFLAGYRSLLNSFGVATISTIISVVVGSIAAYGLARLGRRGDSWAIWFLSQRMLPPIAIAIPMFLLIRELDWIDTWQGLVVPYVAMNTPFVVWMMRGYFSEIPTAIEESALTDGCGRWSAFFRVVVPISLPGIMSTAIFVYIFSWSEFLIALFITQSSRSVTATVELTAFAGGTSVFYGEIAALSLAAAAPILLLGLVIQRYFVRGLTLGAVKG
jgi:multiple sugar transport system permease protein